MPCDFDSLIDRYHSDSIKWHQYDQDVLPMWVADMDFRSPEPVIQALLERVQHGCFGYGIEPQELREVIVDRLMQRYLWEVAPEQLVFVPGVVTGFNLACRVFASPGDGVLVQTPVYPPILQAPGLGGLARHEMELTRQPDGQYLVDCDLFERAITDRTRIFILCNPHNPVGRVFRRDELERMAGVCLRHNMLICSDEIHGDLVLGGSRHTPIASLDPEIAEHTITLMAPSKTFNIAGLQCSVAIIPNETLRKRFDAARMGLIPSVDVFGFTAALAAYRHGQPWLDKVLGYLEDNRDFLLRSVAQTLPGIRMSKPEGTYLAWLDCREANIQGNPQQFFLNTAHVAMNDGVEFGRGGEGFVRLNFGCPQPMLAESLGRMASALNAK
jgi:cysteine-S-conjugate beta-lyase